VQAATKEITTSKLKDKSEFESRRATVTEVEKERSATQPRHLDKSLVLETNFRISKDMNTFNNNQKNFYNLRRANSPAVDF
jgi:hypothetical protein